MSDDEELIDICHTCGSSFLSTLGLSRRGGSQCVKCLRLIVIELMVLAPESEEQRIPSASPWPEFPLEPEAVDPAPDTDRPKVLVSESILERYVLSDGSSPPTSAESDPDPWR